MTRRTGTPALVCLNLLLLTLALALPTKELPRGGRIQVRRSMAAPEPGPLLNLHWVRHDPPLKPAWPDQPLLQFDRAYQPVLLGKNLFLGSSRHDCLTALDVDTGDERWRFFTNGPVRLAPAAWNDKVYLASDDGYLYCLAADTGSLLWKFRGGPSDRLILGNDRLISTWPARGGPVVSHGVVYFAAGIWPFMGIFIHALDAETGKVLWTNDGDGSMFWTQPHHADAFAGVAPQGSLAVAGDKLLVPGGRTVPACYDRWTGKLLHYRLAENSRLGGGDLAAQGRLFVNGGWAFDIETGSSIGTVGTPALLTEERLFACANDQCHIYELSGSFPASPSTDTGYRRGSWSAGRLASSGSFAIPKATAMARDGNRLYFGSDNQVFAVKLPLTRGKAEFIWQAPVEGTPIHLAAADGHLVVSTRQGRIYGFGPEPASPRKFSPAKPMPVAPDAWTAEAGRILARTNVRAGYCIAWGIGTGRLIQELARQSKLRIVVIDPDAVKANALREQLRREGIRSERIAIHVGTWDQVTVPPYVASLMVSEDLATAGISLHAEFVRRAFSSLRPYGGSACLGVSSQDQPVWARLVTDAGLVNAKVTQTRSPGDQAWLELTREGALPGSANWTHEHADAANTRVSQDQLVKAPLGLLWFGGPTHAGILPRHGHGPQPQVIDGRLIIEGPDILRAIDIYTGRMLWETRLPDVGKDFDETAHQPGANASGTNYISTPDGIYVAYGKACLRLDPATGKRLARFKMPRLPGEREPGHCNYLNVAGDYLVCAADPQQRESGSPVSASKYLVVMNRQTGKVLWTAKAQAGFRHNTICIGGDRLYGIDRPTASNYGYRRNVSDVADVKPRLLALDLKTGKEIWSTTDGVFGTWLSYSAQHDVLVEAGRMARDTLYDEAQGMRAYRANRGTVVWYQPTYGGPAMIHGDIILKEKSACRLLTGAPVLRQHPITGQTADWTWTRDYGCNTPLASQHLLTFRSGAAGYFDLANDGGTGNFGGFRSGCTNNLIVAGGVLTAPDYTRTCTCSYQNQTSLALVPMPEAEMWTYYGRQEVTGIVKRVGINFGAPGNRKGPDSTLWLEYPPVGGPSYRLPITVTPSTPEWFRRHTATIEAGNPKWVGASGARGLTSVTIDLAPSPSHGTPGNAAPKVAERSYKVRLYFAEPDGDLTGERRFDVALQGRRVLSDLDIRKEAGGPNRVIVKEFAGIRVTKELMVTLTPSNSAPGSVPVLCGIEIVADGW